LLITVRVALSSAPAPVGLYSTVIEQVFFGPRLVAEQVSVVFVNAAASSPLIDTFNEAVAMPPEFVSVNVCEAVVPGSIVP
jgi:hypothetical protein